LTCIPLAHGALVPIPTTQSEGTASKRLSSYCLFAKHFLKPDQTVVAAALVATLTAARNRLGCSHRRRVHWLYVLAAFGVFLTTTDMAGIFSCGAHVAAANAMYIRTGTWPCPGSHLAAMR
jgi:hypothetical protein